MALTASELCVVADVIMVFGLQLKMTPSADLDLQPSRAT